MVRRMTPSQFNSWIRQQEQRQREAIRRHNQEVDRINRANKAAAEKAVRDYNREIERVNKHNMQVVDGFNREINKYNQSHRSAVTKYNRAVRAHNARVEQDRQRRLSTLRAISIPRHTEVRNSTFALSERYEGIQKSERSGAYSDLITLSEREASNSAMVAEALLTEAPPAPDNAHDTGILEYLAGFSEDVCNRWRGALHALSPTNPDAARHFCTSVREIFSEILNRWAEDTDVIADDPDCDKTQQGTPSRRSKIRYLLRKKGADTLEMLGFVEQDIEDILLLFPILIRGRIVPQEP